MKHSNFVQFLHLITVVPRSFLFMTAVTYPYQSCKKSKSRTTIRQSKNLYHMIISVGARLRIIFWTVTMVSLARF